jgi:hypothetical protein
MKVDLQGVKARLEEQIQQLEQRKSTLQEQITHIEAAQRIVSGLAEMDGHQSGNGQDQAVSVDDEGKTWFKRA